jgi:decaprenylphospho-beta-D-erythro-pentofuranosid-2-ulose 2-reductase
MSKILILGATSTIAEHCARLWAARGDELYLVGRNEERLALITADLKLRGAAKVGSYCMDLNDIDGHRAMLEKAEAELEGLDTVLVAHGTLPNQKQCEHDVQLTLREIRTNALSTVALLTLLANSFEEKRKGIIAVISSVAGDRGRQRNYVYGSAKAMVTAFTSGLRQRLHKSGVAVLTIKPGFVYTPMTEGMDLPPLLTARPEEVAIGIDKAVRQRRTITYERPVWRLVMSVIKLIPEPLFKKLSF